jgi:hypothetical protein
MEIPLVPPSDGLANANAIGTIAAGLDGKRAPAALAGEAPGPYREMMGRSACVHGL